VRNRFVAVARLAHFLAEHFRQCTLHAGNTHATAYDLHGGQLLVRDPRCCQTATTDRLCVCVCVSQCVLVSVCVSQCVLVSVC